MDCTKNEKKKPGKIKEIFQNIAVEKQHRTNGWKLKVVNGAKEGKSKTKGFKCVYDIRTYTIVCMHYILASTHSIDNMNGLQTMLEYLIKKSQLWRIFLLYRLIWQHIEGIFNSGNADLTLKSCMCIVWSDKIKQYIVWLNAFRHIYVP